MHSSILRISNGFFRVNHSFQLGFLIDSVIKCTNFKRESYEECITAVTIARICSFAVYYKKTNQGSLVAGTCAQVIPKL